MLNIALIEDEPLAMTRLQDMLQQSGIPHRVVVCADSVSDALQKLQRVSSPDLIITDVQLGDGDCFELFRYWPPPCPVIFTTAYNEYALEAFQVNAADYLLKPVRQQTLNAALEKVQQRMQPAAAPVIDYVKLARAIMAEEQRYQRRYFIRFGDQIRSIDVSEIAYFYTLSKSVFLVTFSQRTYPLDKTMDVLETELDPGVFFRINRQFIVHVKSISKMLPASKSRIELELEPPYTQGEVVVSTDKSPQFKAWMGNT